MHHLDGSHISEYEFSFLRSSLPRCTRVSAPLKHPLSWWPCSVSPCLSSGSFKLKSPCVSFQHLLLFPIGQGTQNTSKSQTENQTANILLCSVKIYHWVKKRRNHLKYLESLWTEKLCIYYSTIQPHCKQP